MPIFRLGDRAPAVIQIRASLRGLDLLTPASLDDPTTDLSSDLFDESVDHAVRTFQQQRGLTVDGLVGPETWRALEQARFTLGDRVLFHQVTRPFVGDDVAALQSRLLELGFDAGRCDGIFGPRTEGAVRDFQHNYGLRSDGLCGPLTLRALGSLKRIAVGGRSHELREAEALRRQTPSLAGKSIVVDPGHGGADTGWAVGGLCERDLAADLGARLEGRLAAAGVDVFLTRGVGVDGEPPSDLDRAEFANAGNADLFLSLHLDGSPSARPQGVATYYYGGGLAEGSRAGERVAGLIQREIVSRTGLVDCRSHPRTWDLLRLTRMPAVRIEAGYLTNPEDRARLSSPAFRDAVADGIFAAVQRVYLPEGLEPPTGELSLPLLRSRA